MSVENLLGILCLICCRGIGLSFADRLLAIDPTIILCLACRNPSRADTARKTLLDNHPDAKIELVRLDTSDIKGIYDTAKSIKRKLVF